MHRANRIALRGWQTSTRYAHQNVAKIQKVLIANRGEIALRILRTAHRLGLRSVAVYSSADANSPHVLAANEAFYIGEAAPSASYLNQQKVIKAALESGAHAIHPAYGFLSENPEFAQKCAEAGLQFIGPSADAIRAMGIKSTSKHLMQQANVPIIPGYHGKEQNDDFLASKAEEIGYPVMIKAIRGGGGKGMRIALTAEQFKQQLDSARMEAKKAFDNSEVLIERFIRRPRHVEVQVFGDQHGEYVYLFERDCSVQRRHQKIIEEAPAPFLNESLRKELGEAACRAAAAVNYVGAGTVEFILDTETNDFFFMEMNTRLQVEHPITEMITNVDLVEWQFRIANGEHLPLKQDQLQIHGHSFEARIYAEDPDAGFLPSAGTITKLIAPVKEKDMRLEMGIEVGQEVSVYYDPMLAKLVVWGENRDFALAKLRQKLASFVITGLSTNIDFLLRLANDEHFKKGDVYTDYIRDHQESLFPKKEKMNIQNLAKFALGLVNQHINLNNLTDFRVFKIAQPTYELDLKDNENNYKVKVTRNGDNSYNVQVEDQIISNIKIRLLDANRKELLIDFGDHQSRYQFIQDGINLQVLNGEKIWNLQKQLPSYLNASVNEQTFDNKVLSPMPGVMERVMYKEGDEVKKGDQVLVMIAMKMEHGICAPKDTKILKIHYKVGDNVPKDAILIEFE